MLLSSFSFHIILTSIKSSTLHIIKVISFHQVSPAAERLRYILSEDDDMPTPTLFTEMDTLQREGDELEWRESARWMITLVKHTHTELCLWPLKNKITLQLHLWPSALYLRVFCRWVKFEEKVEEGGERWSKPHVSTLSLHSLFELRTCLQTGTVLLDLEGYSLPQIVGKVFRSVHATKTISPLV